MSESRSQFFKQSGWLAIANTLTGVFLMLVYSLVHKMPFHEFGIFTSLLRLFMVLAIPAAGLQIVLAQQTAAAVTPEKERDLSRTVSRVIAAVFGLWLVILLAASAGSASLVRALKLTNPLALWVALGLVLAALCLPIMHGLLQGRQNFAWLGFSLILNGVGRFVAIAIMVFVFGSHATGALFGALLGLVAAVLTGYWPVRNLVRWEPGKFEWGVWLKRIIPLTFGAGSALFLMNTDMVLVQSHFPKEETPYYAAAAVVGVGLVAFTTPLSSVMFPKLVRSFAQREASNSLRLAVAGTGILGGLGALICTFFPELPLRIMYFNQPQFLKSAALVPWFMWSMLPVTLANVFISQLLAREAYRVVPWLVGVAAGYGFTLYWFVNRAGSMPVMEAFERVVQILGAFSTLLLGVALLFTFLENRRGR